MKITLFLVLAFVLFTFARVNNVVSDDNGELICSDKTQIYAYKSVMEFAKTQQKKRS